MDLFEQREAEYQAALAEQAARRRAEVRKDREEVSKEAQKLIAEVIDGIPVPEKKEVVDTRSDFDLVRDEFRKGHPGAAATMKTENYERRRAELTATNTKPTEADIAAANAEADRLNAWLEAEYENEMDAEDAWDED